MEPLQPTVAINPREFRNCCGRFATGVTVVTVEHDGLVHGMTANGFLSVSLEPPLIAVSIGHRTRLHTLLPQTMRYGISILSESQTALSGHFAGRPDETLAIPFIRQHDMPLLGNAVAHLVARVVDVHPVGDHTLYIGQVEYLSYEDKRPLLFFGGAYNQLKADPKPQHSMWHDNELFFYPAPDLLSGD